jgi:hypothetical protein
MLILLLLDIVLAYAFSDNWYEPTIVMIYLVIQILILNYEFKNLYEITQMTNPDQYLSFSLGILKSLYYEVDLYLVFRIRKDSSVKKNTKTKSKKK